MSTPGATRNLNVGDWVQLRYGYGDAKWKQIAGRDVDGYDCWVVASTNGRVDSDTGRDLSVSGQPVHIDSDLALTSHTEPRQLPEWVGRLRDAQLEGRDRDVSGSSGPTAETLCRSKNRSCQLRAAVQTFGTPHSDARTSSDA